MAEKQIIYRRFPLKEVELLTIEDVCRITKLSRGKVVEMRDNKQIPFKWIGGKWRVSSVDFWEAYDSGFAPEGTTRHRADFQRLNRLRQAIRKELFPHLTEDQVRSFKEQNAGLI